MCSIGLALGLVSAAIGAVGAIQQASAQAQAAQTNAQIAEKNTQLSVLRAKDALERGKREEQRKRLEVASILGEQKAGYAASNVDLTFGSPLDVMVDTATYGEMDALTIRSNAYREAFDHEIAASSGQLQAQLYRNQASSAMAGGFLGAMGTLIGGASRAWGQYRTSDAYLGTRVGQIY